MYAYYTIPNTPPPQNLQYSVRAAHQRDHKLTELRLGRTQDDELRSHRDRPGDTKKQILRHHKEQTVSVHKPGAVSEGGLTDVAH